MISVVLPSWNVGKYITECLNSVCGQTYRNLEVIVVDDGSTDDTFAIADEIGKKDSRIKIIRQENAGVSVARNTGLSAATGDLVHFVDPDDKLANADFYERIAAAIGDCDIAVVGFIDEKRSARPAVDYKKLKIYSGKQAKINASGIARRPGILRFIYRRDFLLKNNLKFEPGRVTSQDVMFALPAVYYANKIVTVPGTFYWYRRNPNGAMRDSARAAARKQNKEIIWDRAVRFAVQHGFFLGFRRGFWKWVKLKFFK